MRVRSIRVLLYSATKEFVQLSVSTLLLKGMHVCLSDEIIIFIGAASSVAYYAIIALASGKWMIYLGLSRLLL